METQDEERLFCSGIVFDHSPGQWEDNRRFPLFVSMPQI